MPSAWTLLWAGWGLYFLVVEGMALANSTPGDTLSEHVWAWLGLRNPAEIKIVVGSGVPKAVPAKDVTWRTWVRRFAVVFFMAVLAVHFLVGSNTAGNTVLVAAAVALSATVIVGAVWRWVGQRPWSR